MYLSNEFFIKLRYHLVVMLHFARLTDVISIIDNYLFNSVRRCLLSFRCLIDWCDTCNANKPQIYIKIVSWHTVHHTSVNSKCRIEIAKQYMIFITSKTYSVLIYMYAIVVSEPCTPYNHIHYHNKHLASRVQYNWRMRWCFPWGFRLSIHQ